MCHVDPGERFTVRALRVLWVATTLITLCGDASAATPFVYESIDVTGRTGYNASLALDANGDPHVAYYDLSNHDLRYARRTGAGWVLETVDATGITGVTPSLAIDAFGDPHVAYYDSTGLDLRYARKIRGGPWTVEVVASAGNVGYGPSLVLDAAGVPRISYYDVTNGDLRLASKATGSWLTELVDGAGNVGWFSSLAIDPFGVPKIAYLDITGQRIRFADKATGLWTSLIVDNTTFIAGAFPLSLALDGQGRPRIAYTGVAGSGYLGFAHLDQGIVWSIEYPAGGTGSVGVYPSLVVGPDGAERIAYTDGSGILSLATRIGGGWIQEGLSKVAIHGSMKLDAQGNPRIAYLDQAGEDLRIADSAVRILAPMGGERWASGSTQTVRWTGTGPVDVQISADGGFTYATVAYAVSGGSAVITVPALASEEARVRIVRFNPWSTSESRGTFTIGPDVVSPWWTRTVESTGSVGSFASLELDTHGNPRIAHWDATNGDLRYAARLGGAWTSELVDASNTTGLWASLELDAVGSPCIAYVDATAGNLKFARKTSGMWGIEVVSPASSDPSVSLALDPAGNPHVSFGGTGLDLRYIRKVGGMWVAESVEGGVEISATSLALDGQGNPHIAYTDDLSGSLKYARKSAGLWTIESVGAPGVSWYPSIAVDGVGNAFVAYYDQSNGDLKFARRIDGRWYLETVDAAGSVGWYPSLALDGSGNPLIAYYDLTNGDLKSAARIGGAWWIETVDAAGNVGITPSMALDPQGVPRIAYQDQTSLDLKIASAAIELVDPAPGASWPVGARRTVRWEGTGRVDVSLSVDGGNTWSVREVGLSGGEYRFTVPHLPSKFCKVRVSRDVPASAAESDSFFTIQTSISLLALLAAPAPEGARGAVVSWSTDPGPADLEGYRVERSASGAGGGWTTLVARTRETAVEDASAGPGTRYRLFAINGLGEEILVGETSFAPRAPLTAWPLPYRGGPLTVSFAAGAGFGGGAAGTEVALYDVHGRLVRTIARGPRLPGYHAAAWDGRDDRGVEVAAGVYLLRLRSAGEERTLKVAVLR